MTDNVHELDFDREKRTGFSEVIYGESKTVEQIEAIASELKEVHGKFLVTRLDATKAKRVSEVFPEGDYCELSRTFLLGRYPTLSSGKVLVVCAGTSDAPVAKEAIRTSEWMGCEVESIYDVGVAGLDRILSKRQQLQEASVIIVVAGMEGALASVIGGLVGRPIIAVPTSVGYGTHLNGLTPLLAMLNSCASGMSVVNIDNGFGAAYQAALIMKLVKENGV